MKFILASSALFINLAASESTNYGVSDGDTSTYTCAETAPCLKYTITENPSSICTEDHASTCEFQVCWSQSNDDPSCSLDDETTFSHLGDMHKDEDNFCLNEKGKKGYWDSKCQDGGNTPFSNVCQNVAAGHWTHFLTKKGQSCVPADGSDPTAWINDTSGKGTTAYCGPATSDDTLYPGGQTYFPASKGKGGTCSGNDAGVECVFSVKMPEKCSWEEELEEVGGQATCLAIVNENQSSLCPDKNVLDYYENSHNPEAEKPPIHDIVQNDDGTVTFKIYNIWEDTHDLYVVYKSAAAGGEQCDQERSAGSCPSDTSYTAQCIDDSSWTVVTVFLVGLNDESTATSYVTAGDGIGSNLYTCCPTSGKTTEQLNPANTAAFTYLIHCSCPTSGRMLRVSNDLSARFQRGELFDDELLQIYGFKK